MKIKIGNNEYYTYDLDDIRGKQKSIKFQIEEKVDDISDVIVHSSIYYFVFYIIFFLLSIRKIHSTQKYVINKKTSNNRNCHFKRENKRTYKR